MDEEAYQSSPMSSTIRFLGLLKQPADSDSNNPFELDESDVIWSSDLSDSPTEDFVESSISNSLASTTTTASLSNSPASDNTHRHPFRTESFGLSAALSDAQHPLVQRNRALNPSLSAAQMIPRIPRSGSSAEDYFSGSSSGKYHQSAPVNVPVWRPKSNGGLGGEPEKMGFFDEVDDELGDDEMLPPHEIVARSHVTTFSVFEGVGRTLKGRDLRRVRNAIWQKTGFLD